MLYKYTKFLCTRNGSGKCLVIALVEWMHRCGGGITILKERFGQFEKEILIFLQEYYPVDGPKAGSDR